MRITIVKSLRIFSLTFVISVVHFPHISCSRLHFRRCLENELSAILKMMTVIRTRDNRVHSMTAVEMDKQVDDMLSLILTYLADREIQNPHRKCLMTRKSNQPTRKFFFWPWLPWNWLWKPSPPRKNPLGAGFFGEFTGPLGLGGSFGAGVYYPATANPTSSGNNGNEKYDNINLTPPSPSNDIGVGYDYEPHHLVGYEKTSRTNFPYGHWNNFYDRPTSQYYPISAHQYDYNYLGGLYPSNYNQYPGHYYDPPTGISGQPNYNWYWNVDVNDNNRYPLDDQRKYEISNQDTNTHGEKIGIEHHDFYHDPAQDSHDGQVDDHQFYWDNRHDDKKHDFSWAKDKRKLPIQTGQDYLRQSEDTSVDTNFNMAMDPSYKHE